MLHMLELELLEANEYLMRELREIEDAINAIDQNSIDNKKSSMKYIKEEISKLQSVNSAPSRDSDFHSRKRDRLLIADDNHITNVTLNKRGRK